MTVAHMVISLKGEPGCKYLSLLWFLIHPLMNNGDVTEKDETNCNLDQSGFKNGLRQEGQLD